MVDAAVGAIIQAAPGEPLSGTVAIKKARAIAGDVVSDPQIAPALRPVSWFARQTLQGIAGAGVAQILEATRIVKSAVIAAGWAGQTWNPDEVSTVLSTVLIIAALA